MPFRLRPQLEDVRASLRAQPWNLFGCVLAMAYGIPSAWYPFGSDQGIHWYLGHRLLQGDMPYASGISGKPPLIFVVHAIAEVLFGNHQSSIRILEILALPGFGWLIANGARRVGEPARDGEVGCAALLLSAANYTYQDYWNTAHPEFWMTLTLMASLVIAVHAPPGRRRPLLVGALSMVAFLFKYPGLAVAIPIAALCGFRALYTDGVLEGERAPDSGLRAPGKNEIGSSPALPEARSLEPGAGSPLALRPTKPRWFAFMREAAWFLTGAALVLFACLLPFFLTGTMREMFEVCVLMTEHYASSPEFPWDWYRPLFDPYQQGTFFDTMTVLFVLGAGVTIWRKRYSDLAFGVFLFALVLASIASVVMQKRLFTYHWLATYPFFIASAVWGVRQVVKESRVVRAASPLLLAVAVLFTAGAFFYRPAFITKRPHTYREHVERWWSVMRGETTRDELTMSYHRFAQADKFGDLVRASQTIRDRARPGDAVCLTCFISPIYQLTDMRCTMRHAIGSFVSMGPKYWAAEYTQLLHDNPPRFMVSIHTYPRRNRLLVKLGYREIARYGTVMVFEYFGSP